MGSSWTVPKKPGVKYSLSTDHYIWLWSVLQAGSNDYCAVDFGYPNYDQPKPPTNKPCGGPYSDPQRWTTRPTWDGSAYLGGAATLAFRQITIDLPRQALQNPWLQSESPNYKVAHTESDFTSLSIAPEANQVDGQDVRPVYLYQTQHAYFDSNAGDIIGTGTRKNQSCFSDRSFAMDKIMDT